MNDEFEKRKRTSDIGEFVEDVTGDPEMADEVRKAVAARGELPELKACAHGCGDSCALLPVEQWTPRHVRLVIKGYTVRCNICESCSGTCLEPIDAINLHNRRASGWIDSTPETMPKSEFMCWIWGGESIHEGFWMLDDGGGPACWYCEGHPQPMHYFPKWQPKYPEPPE